MSIPPESITTTEGNVAQSGPVTSSVQPATTAPKRIKRQRRKLRGKYSGDCVSCTAKWSKCWYIASVDNKLEWETRLGISVSPTVDEVCFQCWDGKIRTSPKRKQTKLDVEVNPGPDFTANMQDTLPPQESPTLTLTQTDLRLAAINLKSSDPIPSSSSKRSPKGSESNSNPLGSSDEGRESPMIISREASPSPRGLNKRSYDEDHETRTRSEASETTITKTNSARNSDGFKFYSTAESELAEHEAVLLLSTAFKTLPASPRQTYNNG